MRILNMLLLTACAAGPDSSPESADVVGVKVSGSVGDYSFAVTVRSPDAGCERYADWWEVVSPEGELLYRRILGHSHVDEQPFTRSGEPVDVAADSAIVVRAHLHPDGYGQQVWSGSVDSGLKEMLLDSVFSEDLSQEAPLPSGCAF
ncbi:MAG: hypothetical protein ACI9MC_001923 [Kiritimatiellia bacterium]|jgi:hypothetical protein